MDSIETNFNNQYHKEVCSEDGSFTAYSKEYDEHYHSTKDGALKESYKKHVLPAFELKKGVKELNILDICYGLGFNTLCTLLYYKEHAPDVKLNIYSPELDSSLVESLQYFSYPKEFDELREVITALSRDGIYRDEQFSIELYLGDARTYLNELKLRFKESNKFDIVYQDAFSPSANPILWTKEYFEDIGELMKKDGVLTTYSTAFKTRLALYENGFNLYLNEAEGIRRATLASLGSIDGYELVDMEHKIACNRDVSSLCDRDL